MVATERDLERAQQALEQAMELALWHGEQGVEVEQKADGSPVTAADREINAFLQDTLPEAEDGWLSEESPDDLDRLQSRRVWVVDPVDGTRSFVAGRPDYSISIALLIDRQPVLGAVGAPAHGVRIVGGAGLGVRVTGEPDWQWSDGVLPQLRLFASRSEMRRGDWQAATKHASIQPVGSIAYMMALVAAGVADATWTQYPKHEWDVAAGAALVHAAGGECWLPRGGHMLWNRNRPRFLSFAAAGRDQRARVTELM